MASIKESSGIALGNILGSNISNTLLILGVSAFIAPLAVKKTTITKEIPFLLLSILAVAILVNDLIIDGFNPNGLTRIDGLILVLFFSIFVYYTFGISREKNNIYQKTIGALREEKTEIDSIKFSVLKIIIGMTVLTIGGQWIVNGAITIAGLWGMSEALIGLTIVAIGTSLPELAASVMAAKKGNTDIAVGNVIGSNIFNLLWVLGLSSVIHPINYVLELNIDFAILFGVTIILLITIYLGKKNILGRLEGLSLVFIYFAYMTFVIFRG
jgi:cation:H+ antiporter